MRNFSSTGFELPTPPPSDLFPPCLQRLPYSSPRPILIKSSTRDEGKVSIFVLCMVSNPKLTSWCLTGLLPQFLGWYLLPELWGTPHTSSPWTISIVRGCREEGEGEFCLFLYCWADTHLLMFWSRADAVPSAGSPLRELGLLAAINTDGFEPQRQGECKCFISFALHPTRTHFSLCDVI